MRHTESDNYCLPLVGTTSWTIGRHKDSAIVLSDSWVSRNHALLQASKIGNFYLIDLDSSNGSFVNGIRIYTPVALQHGDRLTIGKTELEFLYSSAVSPVEATVDLPKTVLLTQSSQIQGKIWSTILTSQGISVAWEPATAKLDQVIQRIQRSGQELPGLLIVDIETQKPNPYAFCRRFRDHYPELKIILTCGKRQQISRSEQQWAIHQGAVDLLPGFQEENLLAGVVDLVAVVNRALEALACKPVQQKTFLTVLLSLQHSMSSVERSNEQSHVNSSA
jgi:CheY-like chemotaxis protein